MRLFENSVIETDVVLNEISELLKNGVHYSDIAVTCVDNDTAGLLLAKAAMRNIPINFRKGKPLSEYPAGRLPELLRACRNGRLRYRDHEKPAFVPCLYLEGFTDRFSPY